MRRQGGERRMFLTASSRSTCWQFMTSTASQCKGIPLYGRTSYLSTLSSKMQLYSGRTQYSAACLKDIHQPMTSLHTTQTRLSVSILLRHVLRELFGSILWASTLHQACVLRFTEEFRVKYWTETVPVCKTGAIYHFWLVFFQLLKNRDLLMLKSFWTSQLAMTSSPFSWTESTLWPPSRSEFQEMFQASPRLT